jgi:hypothetical protein
MLRSPLFLFSAHFAFQIVFLFAYGYATMVRDVLYMQHVMSSTRSSNRPLVVLLFL